MQRNTTATMPRALISILIYFYFGESIVDITIYYIYCFTNKYIYSNSGIEKPQAQDKLGFDYSVNSVMICQC